MNKHPQRLIARLKCLASPAVALLAAVSAGAQTFTFDPSGSTWTLPQSINASGAITGYFYYAGYVQNARWLSAARSWQVHSAF